ncbi:MAG: hypothetical protein ACE37F_30490 [Nannocystaceae bacterium]|nr:hypothetical protein [bacterium]
MNRPLLSLATAAAVYVACGVPDADALECFEPAECVCRPGVSTILYVSSAVYTEDSDLEVDVIEAYGEDIGAEPGETIVLPNRPEAGPGENLLVYVVDGEIDRTRAVDEGGVLDCPTSEPLDIEQAVEIGLRQDCSDYVEENLTPDDSCPTGACEASVGGKPGALATLLGLFGFGLFARRRPDALRRHPS